MSRADQRPRAARRSAASPPVRRGFATPRSSYLGVLGAAVLCYAALGAVLRVLPELVSDRAALGLLVGAPALTAVVTRPLGGRAADRIGSWPVLAAGATVMAAGVVPALV